MNTHFSFSCWHLCLLVVLALFHLCYSNQNSDQILCMDGERQALLRFKHGLIDEAHRLASWVVEDKDCCRWVGITCENSTGHVHRIHLSGLHGNCHFRDHRIKEYREATKQMLKGDISSSLLDLKQLTHLDLSCNDFEGIQVPKFIGSLQNLRYLNLSNSNFGEIIPPQLGNLSKLHVLCLGGTVNNYYSPFASTTRRNIKWLTNLSMLQHLDMSGVDLNGATYWLQVINTLPSLVELHLSRCYLSNTHLYVPSLNLTFLSLLDLSFNNFNSSVPRWVFGLTSLVSLDLTGCDFYGNIPNSIDSFHNLTSLKFLHVSGNDFMNSSLVFKGLSSSNLISLHIGFCGISNSLLGSLHNLTSLLSLDLSRNQITTRIPKSLGNLCNLIEIDLSLNNIGNISLAYLLESFFECKSPALESLSLFGNYIDGTIPNFIGHLSFLRTLDLHINKISGPIPYSIGELSSLEDLNLSENQLDGSLPESLGQLSNLISLDFSYNFLTGIVTEAHFAKLVSLKLLFGTDNKNLTLRSQTNWVPPFKLQQLLLKSWDLGPQFPMWLQSQEDLVYLDISNTSISSPMPESFVRSFPYLYYLHMSNNHIQGTLMSFDIPATLQIVDLSSNELLGSLRHLLCSNGVTTTYVLNLGNNHLSGVIPECWEMWPRLVVLNLENNNFSGEIPRTLGSIPSLQSLNMRGNKISGRLPSSLMNLTGLEILQLGRNELVGSIPTWIGTELGLLIIINLRSNKLDGNISHELCYLTSIQILDLAHNNLSGNIPRCFNNFSVLSGIETNSNIQIFFLSGPSTSIAGDSLVMKGREDTYSTILGLVRLLDLSSNNLIGHIPSELTSLVELKSLNLSRNQLTGRIPEKIGDMKALESFDLSLNKLFGELPISLSSLHSLSSFNVSYNNLTGKIPTSTQIQSFNESSFFGNKLCGPPLTKTEGCVPVVPIDTTQEQKEDDGEDWGLIISMVVGFISGFWMIVGPLVVRRSWRIVYFGVLSKLWYIMKKCCCHMFSK